VTAVEQVESYINGTQQLVAFEEVKVKPEVEPS